jgi:D-xylose transport system substrate-binding protein
MRTRIVALAAVALLVSGLTACTDDGADAVANDGFISGGSGPARVGVILPDTTTAQRWEKDDPKFLQAAFDKAGVQVEIQNARGDAASFRRIANGMLSTGVKVLIVVSLDPVSGRAVLDKAEELKIPTIDYDRLTLNGDADFYVSFDNIEVGRQQANGLIQCLKTSAASKPLVVNLNGAPTDNNAAQFKEGYDSVLVEKYDAGEFNEGPDQDVPKWDDKEAGVIFEEMMVATRNDIDGVLAANDGLGNAAISVLRKHKRNGAVPVTGQDASVKGLQNILLGDQCMTVYKPIRQEADAAAELAISLFRGGKASAAQLTRDPVSGADVQSVLLPPKPIFKNNVKDVIIDGFATKKDVCTGEFAQLCKENGIR